ncbi:GNAT family N-acetyltransferase [Bacillus sp. KH172YL63]|uniref:GNAT family N-acetyltransferase n=1 Tax=Bacillus sp. KH172YL63 TaxID=2709784 RepID=UPI0013E41D18|nr:GNAT family protein [Bacillus sp. KH172YL63]BCB03099.1 N-acetyltransferase [Bacillus sp. KH172YL63]
MDGTYLTSGLFLRKMMDSDWKDIHEYASLERVSRYQCWGPNTEQDTIEYVQGVLDDEKVNPQTRFVSVLVEALTGRVIGAGEITIKSRVNACGEIGYILHPDYWGKGIGTLLGSALIERGFGHNNLHRIEATCDPWNQGSKGVLRNIGMTLEGQIRHHLRIDDGWRDSLVYAIFEYEWEGTSKAKPL